MSKSSLYYPLASFIGPVHQLAKVEELLITSRLLTLIGVGGCGKTHLAYEVVGGLSEKFEHGKWWVDLTTLDDPALVLQSVASVLCLPESTTDSLMDALLDFLRSKDLLLVLDGCEHLVTVCAQLVEILLRACPRLHILVTSREALRVTGEIVWQVPPLALPVSLDLPPLEELMHYTAIQLFMERATAVSPTFTLTNENAKTVVQICHRLDSLPMAIELAAAWMNVLSIEQIASHLDDYWSLLTRGSRTALPRHQTLQANIDWSYRLLSEKEQDLFRRFSIFAGDFTLDAAETVCAFKGIEKIEVLKLLSQLVDKSLVMVETSNEKARYHFIGIVRHYAYKRLRDSGEESIVRNRLLDWYLDVVERASLEQASSRLAIWIDCLKMEYDNLAVMLQWAIQQGEIEKAAWLYKAFRHFGLLHDQEEQSSPRSREKPMLFKAKTPLELRIFALGPIQVYQGEHLISPADRMYVKTKELLFYLLCHRSSTKEQIGLALWPDVSPIQLRSSFHSTLHLLRRALGQGEWIIFENGYYSFNWQLPYWFDVEAFETNIAQARKLQVQVPRQAISYVEAAVKLYQGDFLHDISNGNWHLPKQQELCRMYLDALLTLGQFLSKEELYLRAIDIYRQIIAHDQFLEVAHRELMRCYAFLGERSQALRHYQELVTLFYEEFGASPAPETRALFELLRQGGCAG